MNAIEKLADEYFKEVKWFWTIVGNVAVEHFKYWADKFKAEVKNK